MRYQHYILLALLTPPLVSCSMQNPTHRDTGDSLFAEGKYEQAIHEYEHHIQDRLKLHERPEWENPYLYYLDIGDAYLRLGRPDLALGTYLEAEQRNVEPRFVNDRIRSLARWYVEEQEPLKAIDILKKYRERDPLLFDMMLDRISRSLAAQGYDPLSDSETSTTPKPHTPGRK